MGLFDIFKKKTTVEPKKVQEEAPVTKPEEKKAPEGIDLTSILDNEELRLLSTDLECVAMKVPDSRDVVDAVKRMIATNGIIPKQALSLCVLAAQEAIDTVEATIGITMGGHTELLKKLKDLKETVDANS